MENQSPSQTKITSQEINYTLTQYRPLEQHHQLEYESAVVLCIHLFYLWNKTFAQCNKYKNNN